MDEKELMEQTNTEETAEITADENIEEITEIFQENPEEVIVDTTEGSDEESELSDEFQDDFIYSEDADETAEDIYMNHKKDFVIQKPIIIACCILLCSIIAFGGLVGYTKLFGNNVTGTWVRSDEMSADKATKDHKGNGVTYYTFESDGDAYLTLGTMRIMGKWAHNEEDAGKINVSISYFFNGTFSAEVDGNVFTGKTLTMKDEYGSEYKFASSSIPDMYADKKENAKIDDKILGTWNNEQLGITYIFRPDGSCTLNQSDELIIEGVYSASKSKIKMSYISNETTDTNFDYTINKDNTVKIGGYVFTKKD